MSVQAEIQNCMGTLWRYVQLYYICSKTQATEFYHVSFSKPINKKLLLSYLLNHAFIERQLIVRTIMGSKWSSEESNK